MPLYTIDTNARPILQREFASPAEVKRFIEASIPLLQKRGFTHSWRKSHSGWNVIDIFNSKQRPVHSAAFKRGPHRR